MMLEIKQYKPGIIADFYIQCKGDHSGRPLKFPIPNCFAVTTDITNLEQLVYALYVGRYFEPHIKGSVVPYIRIGDAFEVIWKGIEQQNGKALEVLKTLEKIERQQVAIKSQLGLIQQLRVGLAQKVFM